MSFPLAVGDNRLSEADNREGNKSTEPSSTYPVLVVARVNNIQSASQSCIPFVTILARGHVRDDHVECVPATRCGRVPLVAPAGDRVTPQFCVGTLKL